MSLQVHTIDLTTQTLAFYSKLAESKAMYYPSGSGEVVASNIKYAHNVLPIDSGFTSVELVEVAPIIDGNTFNILQVFEFYSLTRNRVYLAIDSAGFPYALDPETLAWNIAATPPGFAPNPGANDHPITFANVNGVGYILYPNYGCYVYRLDINTLQYQALTGLAIADIISISDSQGYLVAATINAVAWSSTTDPTDFTPSRITGAGGGAVQEIRGDIQFLTPTAEGILIHADANIVSALYTGEVRFPFRFIEVANVASPGNIERVAYNRGFADNFIYSVDGMQRVGSRQAEPILPGLQDFFNREILEDYDGNFIYDIPVDGTDHKLVFKIALLASRYLIISYGYQPVPQVDVWVDYQFAFVFDIQLKTLGRLKFTHADCFELLGNDSLEGLSTLAFIQNTGKVSVLKLDVGDDLNISDSVLILGDFMLTERKLMEVSKIFLDQVYSTEILTRLGMLRAIDDGAMYAHPISYTLLDNSSGSLEALIEAPVKKVAIKLQAAFNLTHAAFEYTVRGTN